MIRHRPLMQAHRCLYQKNSSEISSLFAQASWPRRTVSRRPSRQRNRRSLPGFTWKAAALSPPSATERRGVTFPIPVDYTQLLGLKGREYYYDSQISSAYEDLLSATLESGYSERIQDGKEFLLQQALDELRQTKGRTALDSPGLCLEWVLFPSALALLQQAGEPDVVLEAGEKALLMKDSKPFRRDILLSMALAQCSLAAQAFDTKDEVRIGCARLEEALALLRDGGNPPLAPGLEADIMGALRELRAACVLEQLKLSLSLPNAPVRAQAVAVLKELLANPGSALTKDGRSTVDAVFVRCALQQLTSHEVVQLLDWVDLAESPDLVPWYYPGLLKTVGLAHLIVGFLDRRPALVKVGEDILAHSPEGSTAIAERAVAKMLLGEPDSAIELFQEAEGVIVGPSERIENRPSTRYPEPLPEPAGALQYIRSNTPEEDSDLLHGLCLYSELWLSKVGFASFRDTAEELPVPSLTSYFEDKRVTSYLSLHNRDGPVWKTQLVRFADGLIQGISRTTKAVPLKSIAGPEATSGPQVAPRADTLTLARVDMPALRRHARQSKTQQVAIWAGLAGAIFLCVGLLAASRRLPGRNSLPSSVDRLHAGAVQQMTRAKGFVGDIRSAVAYRPSTDKKLELTFKEAETLIRRWQAVKSDALGPRHVKLNIPTVAAGQLEKELVNNARMGESLGWFWKYQFGSIKVEHIDLKPSTGTAVITARVHEKGELFAANGQKAQDHCFDSAMTVEYTIKKTIRWQLQTHWLFGAWLGS
eukprot:jgi/Botrbrau1/12813/Bobra.20_1s0004.1